MTLAGAVAPRRVVGIDISAPLLDWPVTGRAEAGAANVQFVEMDVQTGR